MINQSATDSVSGLVVHEEAVDKVREFIRDIEAKVAEHFVLNFYAWVGFGKTTLLHQMWQAYEHSLPTSLVEVSRYRKEGEEFDLRSLLADIVRQLGERIPKRLISLPSEFDRSVEEIWLAEQVIALIKAAAAYDKVVLLLLDDYDQMPAQPRSWFEANVLSQAIRTEQVAVILTSERELRFTERMDLRMRFDSCELPSLTEETITHTFPRYTGIAPEIFRLTGGLPVCTDRLVQYLNGLDIDISTPAQFRAHERKLIKGFYRVFIDEQVFRDLEQGLRDTLAVLSLLRRFDIVVLGGLLPKVLPTFYKRSSKADYFDLIEHLGSRIQWRKEGGYALIEGLRILLATYTLAQRPKTYEQVNRAMLALYRRQLKREYREYYLLELLYHRLALLKSEKGATPSTLQMTLGKELQPFITGGSKTGPFRIEDLDSLRHSLLQDPDLKDHVSENVLRAIQGQIDVQIEMKRVIPFRRTL